MNVIKNNKQLTSFILLTTIVVFSAFGLNWYASINLNSLENHLYESFLWLPPNNTNIKNLVRTENYEGVVKSYRINTDSVDVDLVNDNESREVKLPNNIMPGNITYMKDNQFLKFQEFSNSFDFELLMNTHIYISVRTENLNSNPYSYINGIVIYQ